MAAPAIMSGAKLACVASFLLLAMAVYMGQASATTDGLSHINKILGFLNNKEKCQLPSYEEIDALQDSFDEQVASHGAAWLDSNPDYKRALDTVLDQWLQRYLTTRVIKSAKTRAILIKVEKYQMGKYGFSICTRSLDDGKGNAVERNHLESYVKQIRPDGTPDMDGPAARRLASEHASAETMAPHGSFDAYAPKSDSLTEEDEEREQRHSPSAAELSGGEAYDDTSSASDAGIRDNRDSGAPAAGESNGASKSVAPGAGSSCGSNGTYAREHLGQLGMSALGFLCLIG